MPTSVIEVRSIFEATQYLRKFIASFSAIVAPLHIVTKNELGTTMTRSLKELKAKIHKAHINDNGL
jgi:hypothetical protein